MRYLISVLLGVSLAVHADEGAPPKPSCKPLLTYLDIDQKVGPRQYLGVQWYPMTSPWTFIRYVVLNTDQLDRFDGPQHHILLYTCEDAKPAMTTIEVNGFEREAAVLRDAGMAPNVFVPEKSSKPHRKHPRKTASTSTQP